MKEESMKRTIRILGICIAALVVFGIAAAAIFIKNQKKPEEAPSQTATTSAPAPTLTQPPSEAVSTAGQAGEPESVWALRLVNRNHAIPENYKIDLTTFGNKQHFDSRAFSHLQAMLDGARKEGLKPLVCASYRTQQQQQELFDDKVRRLQNEGYSHDDAVKTAKEWVAYPGTGEHQIGLAVDIVSLNYQLLEENQKDTPEAKWLRANCWKYGFILRYPEDKVAITGVGFEPWHFRYVGKDAAEKIMKQGICLEEYLNEN